MAAGSAVKQQNPETATVHVPAWLQHPGLGGQERVPKEQEEHAFPASLHSQPPCGRRGQVESVSQAVGPSDPLRGAGPLLRGAEQVNAVIGAD